MRTGIDVLFEMVGVNVDEARQQIIAAEVQRTRHRRSGFDGNDLAILDHDRAMDDVIGQHDPRSADHERGLFARSTALRNGIHQHRPNFLLHAGGAAAVRRLAGTCSRTVLRRAP
jgi:hypothetical protein